MDCVRVEDPGPISTILTVINYWSIIPIYLIQKYPNPEFQDVRANISKDCSSSEDKGLNQVTKKSSSKTKDSKSNDSCGSGHRATPGPPGHRHRATGHQPPATGTPGTAPLDREPSAISGTPLAPPRDRGTSGGANRATLSPG